jgi:hypothetical protein
MEAFAREIINTSSSRGSVGEKVLGFSIPRTAAERTYETGDHKMLAMEPDLLTTAFCSFDPAYSQLLQHGAHVRMRRFGRDGRRGHQ